MKNIFKLFMLLTLAGNIISCNNSTDLQITNSNVKNFAELEKASWLIGEWQNNSSESNTSEVWEKNSDSSYFGKGYFIIGKDTVSSETISLEQNGNHLFYIPTVKNQNDGQPIKFTLTSSTSNQLIFENPKHDFPQKISYTQITNDSLLAEISGMIDGKQNSKKFPMTRKK